MGNAPITALEIGRHIETQLSRMIIFLVVTTQRKYTKHVQLSKNRESFKKTTTSLKADAYTKHKHEKKDNAKNMYKHYKVK